MARKTSTGENPAAEELPTVSSSNTKKEILDAYEAILEELDAKRQAELNPEKVKEEKKKQEVVQAADAEAQQGIDQKIGDLRVSFGNALGDLGDKLKQEMARYRQVQQAIEFKESELREIYEIETNAASLAALLEAQRRSKQEFEEEISEQREALDRELTEKRSKLEADIEVTRAAWRAEKTRYEGELAEQKAEEEKEQKRRREEFEYAFKRECQEKRDKLADELAQLSREIHGKREEFERETAAKEIELAEREEQVSAREQRIDELQKQVDAFPRELAANVDKAVAEVTERLTLRAENDEKLSRAEHEGQKGILESKIQAQESLVKSQQKQNEDLTTRLEAAYAKVQDIAIKAVDSASKQMKNITVRASSTQGKDADE